MRTVVEDWLVSFANKDWDSMGSLRLYSTALRENQQLIGSLDDPWEQLEQKRKTFKRRRIQSRFKNKTRLHSRFFSSILVIIDDMSIRRMSLDLARACLILLSVFDVSLDLLKRRESKPESDEDEDVSREVFFLEGIIRTPPVDSEQWQQHLGDLIWDIRDDPYKAKTNVEAPVNFFQTLFDKEIILRVPNSGWPRRREEVSVPARNPTVYDVLKSIHDFYLTVEEKKEWKANKEVLLRGITRLSPASSNRTWNVFLYYN